MRPPPFYYPTFPTSSAINTRVHTMKNTYWQGGEAPIGLYQSKEDKIVQKIITFFFRMGATHDAKESFLWQYHH